MNIERLHPADDRLIALYFGDEEAGADQRPSVRQHLHGCEPCTWRYTELTAPLERLRRDAATEADEVFTSERLDRQRAQVMARLESIPTDSRVIPFPGSTARLDRTTVRQPLSRWIAAAAAAGLVLGATGRWVFEGGRHDATQPPVARAATVSSVVQPMASVGADANAGADELALSELDQAVHTQRIAALAALDELTPHIRPEAMIARARAIR